MMEDTTLYKTISRQCLNGSALPKALEALWASQINGDTFLQTTLGWRLLQSLDALQQGYGEQIAAGDHEILANVRAHQQVFRRIGFFAENDAGDFLGFDFDSTPASNPPVVVLDTEGQYAWKGIDIREALLRDAENFDAVDEVRQWLIDHDLPPDDYGEIGASTQFLPSVQDFHDRLYRQALGTQFAPIPPAKSPAMPDDPTTWLSRPGNEVRNALSLLLKHPAENHFPRQWVDCNADGRVRTVWFHDVPETHDIAVSGAQFGSPQSQLKTILGDPSRTGVNWMTFPLPNGRLRLGLQDDKVNEMCLMLGNPP